MKKLIILLFLISMISCSPEITNSYRGIYDIPSKNNTTYCIRLYNGNFLIREWKGCIDVHSQNNHFTFIYDNVKMIIYGTIIAFKE